MVQSLKRLWLLSPSYASNIHLFHQFQHGMEHPRMPQSPKYPVWEWYYKAISHLWYILYSIHAHMPIWIYLVFFYHNLPTLNFIEAMWFLGLGFHSRHLRGSVSDTAYL